jgi:hypothetical protein
MQLQETVQFPGIYRESQCQISIYVKDNRQIAVVSELESNSGTSAINCFEDVAEIATKQFGLDPETTVWISHSPPGPSMIDTEDFYKVPIQWNGSEYEMTTAGAWEKLSKRKVEELVGRSLP